MLKLRQCQALTMTVNTDLIQQLKQSANNLQRRLEPVATAKLASEKASAKKKGIKPEKSPTSSQNEQVKAELARLTTVVNNIETMQAETHSVFQEMAFLTKELNSTIEMKF